MTLVPRRYKKQFNLAVVITILIVGASMAGILPFAYTTQPVYIPHYVTLKCVENSASAPGTWADLTATTSGSGYASQVNLIGRCAHLGGCDIRITVTGIVQLQTSLPTTVTCASPAFGVTRCEIKNFYKQNDAFTGNFVVSCINPASCAFSPTSIKVEERATLNRVIYMEGYGMGMPSLEIPGTNDCRFSTASPEASRLYSAQIKNGTVITPGTQLTTPQSFAYLWTLDTTYGYINPLNGQQYRDATGSHDVICKPFTGLYSVERVQTVGGTTYLKEGQPLLLAGETGKSICCNGGQCFGSKCENYLCNELATCDSCDPSTYQGPVFPPCSNNVMQKSSCEKVGTQYCVVTKNVTVKCCTGGCGDNQRCDPATGCYDINQKDQCPPNACCNVPGVTPLGQEVNGTSESKSGWTTQSCIGDKTCCYNAASSRGECVDTCVGNTELLDSKGGGEYSCQDFGILGSFMLQLFGGCGWVELILLIVVILIIIFIIVIFFKLIQLLK